MKIHVMLLYHMRDEFIMSAISSLGDAMRPNYDKLTIIDDTPKEKVFNYGAKSWYDIHRHNTRVSKLWPFEIITIGDREEEKCGHTRMGYYMNQTVQKSDADLFLMLCDDDCIYPRAFDHITKFFSGTPLQHWGYGMAMNYDARTAFPHIRELGFFRPSDVDYPFVTSTLGRNRLDISQVVWRRQSQIDAGAWFPDYTHPKQRPLDFCFYEQMDAEYGECPFMNCVVQYKGQHPGQLSKGKPNV